MTAQAPRPWRRRYLILAGGLALVVIVPALAEVASRAQTGQPGPAAAPEAPTQSGRPVVGRPLVAAAATYRTQCWQEGVKVIDEPALTASTLRQYGPQNDLLFEDETDQGLSVAIVAVGTGLCLVKRQE